LPSNYQLTWSGAIHELLRTHPAIGLPSLLQARQAAALSLATKP
jgi:hypothetical protein